MRYIYCINSRATGGLKAPGSSALYSCLYKMGCPACTFKAQNLCYLSSCPLATGYPNNIHVIFSVTVFSFLLLFISCKLMFNTGDIVGSPAFFVDPWLHFCSHFLHFSWIF